MQNYHLSFFYLLCNCWTFFNIEFFYNVWSLFPILLKNPNSNDYKEQQKDFCLSNITLEADMCSGMLHLASNTHLHTNMCKGITKHGQVLVLNLILDL